MNVQQKSDVSVGIAYRGDDVQRPIDAVHLPSKASYRIQSRE